MKQKSREIWDDSVRLAPRPRRLLTSSLYIPILGGAWPSMPTSPGKRWIYPLGISARLIRSAPLRRRFLRKEAGAYGETHQARDVVDIQAIHQFHAVVFHGLGTDLEEFGYELGVVAFSDELEDLALAARQLFKRGLALGDAIDEEGLRQARGDFLAEIDFLLRDALERGGQFGDSGFFQQVAQGPGLERLTDIVRSEEHREN